MLRRDFLRLLERVGNIIILIFGILFIPKQIKDLTHSDLYEYVSLFALLVILLVTTIFYILPYPTQRRFGIEKYHTSPILICDKETVYIDRAFQAIIKTEKDIVYPEVPTEYDRVDLIEVSPNENFDSIYYASDDSVVEKKIRKSNSCVAFIWEPKNKIIPYVVYSHHTEYISPSNYGTDAFFHIHHVDLNTGVIQYIFNCSHPIELAVAFMLPYFHTAPLYRLFDKLTFIKKRRDCRQPVVSQDQKTITWKLIAPKRNRSYAIFVIYKDQTANFRNSIDQRNWLMRKLFPDKTKVV
jgi:hypothetical protein